MQTLILTGGGSAGHVVPNLALVPELRRHFRLAYIGTDGIERKLAERAGIPFYTIPAAKLVRGSLRANLTLPFRLHTSVRAAKEALREAEADAVFSKGGYVALPVVWAARSLKIPAVTHESDRTPGLANKLIARSCCAALTNFPETAQLLRGGAFTGPPIRQELFAGNRAQARYKYGFSGEKPVLLAFGGGSGSAALNRALEGALPALLPHCDVLHIRGKNAEGRGRSGYVPLAYEPDMASAYACADYVLARAGSNTVFEVLALHKPALFIPLENRRSRGDQIQNAAYFERQGLCRVLHERDLTPSHLCDALRALAADAALRRRLEELDLAGGNRTIVAAILRAVAPPRK